jgi:predicted alpha-1,2-mannosidase
MPVTGELKINEDDRASWFSHKAEIAKPHYYSVYLADYDVTAEVTPTERAAIFRFTFPENENSYILLDAFKGGSSVKIIPEERKIVGYCQNNSGGVPANFKNWFVAVFDKDFEITKTWKEENLLETTESVGSHTGAVIGFKTKKGEKVHVKVASSFISPEQAELNLTRELGEKTFAEIQTEGEEIWEKELSKIKIEGGTDQQQRTFYSSLYRVLLFPRKFFEINEKNEIVHYSPYNGEVLPGYMFTDNGFWDTFRAVFPFFTLMYPELNSQIMEGLVNTYKESGWLPEWASPGHRDCMIGSNSASLIADSYLKGIRGYDIETLYEAILKNSESGHDAITSVGRFGAEYYNKLGYIPYNVGIRENTARTLEYAYADYCIWKLAQELGRPQAEIDLYKNRAQNYRNVFDAETKLMRGKNEDGTFQSPFSPYKWGDAFTEGNSWHYTWSVFQDVEGLKQLMGGDDSFVAMLDSVFVVPPVFDDSYYGFTIHEIREMQIAGMGNYAHGNQPIQHMIYLYNYTNQPWKTQKHVREVLTKLYTPQADGYCGDEDNGQTSAWYVFSSMGFYPVCPGSGEYVFGAPLFNKITVQLENGKEFVIDAANNSKENLYVSGISLNGKPWDKNYITHEALLQGGNLSFTMANQPDKTRGTGKESWPYSMSK